MNVQMLHKKVENTGSAQEQKCYVRQGPKRFSFINHTTSSVKLDAAIVMAWARIAVNGTVSLVLTDELTADKSISMDSEVYRVIFPALIHPNAA